MECIMSKEIILDYITDAAGRFYTEAGIEYPSNAREYYRDVLANPLVFAKVIVGKGFLVAMAAPSFLHPGKLQASELAWYVEPEFRGTSTAIKLMKMYEAEALERGCTEIGMVCLESINPETTGKIYEKLGYNKHETHYIKEVK